DPASSSMTEVNATSKHDCARAPGAGRPGSALLVVRCPTSLLTLVPEFGRALSSFRGATRTCLEVVAGSGLVAASGRARRGAFGLRGASTSQDGPDAVVNDDGEPGVRVGRDLCRAWFVGVGGDSVRLSARHRAQHLDVCADSALPAVP